MTLRAHGLTFALFQTKDGRHGFRYKVGSRWRQCVRRDPARLREDADRIALALINGETAAIDLSAEDRRIYVSAREALHPHGLRVDTAARDIAEAITIVGRGVSLRELATHYARSRPQGEIHGKTVADTIASVKAAQGEREMSGRFKRGLHKDFERLESAFGPREIASITPEELLEWLRGLQRERGFAWKRRNHLRNAAVYLWSHAKRMQWLPGDRDTSAQRVPLLPTPRRVAPITTYRPEEMRSWIANIRPKYLPWLLLCGFSPLRSEEVAPDPESGKDPLRWEDIDLVRRQIRVRRETSKVREPRTIPIPDNLAAWLEPWSQATGPVCPGEQPSKRETSRLSRISSANIDGRVVQIRWKPNALRHTVISARLAILKSRAQVAEEAGTSETKIRQHYHEPMDQAQAKAWYAITPDRAQNILPLWAVS